MHNPKNDFSYTYNLYKSIFENSLNAIVLLDENSNYVALNDKYTEITGFSRSEVINKPIGSITYYKDVDDIQTAFRDALNNKIDSFEKEFRIVHKNSQIRWVKLNAIKYYIKEKKFFILVEFYDITQQLEIKNALVESEKKYRTLFDANQDSIILLGFDESGKPEKFLDCNETTERMTGMTKEEFLNSPPFDFDMQAKENMEVARERQKKILEEGFAHFETTVKNKHGKLIDVDVIAKLFELNNQTALMTINRDITERKKAEVALKESEEKYRTLFEESLAAVLVADDNGNYVFANRAATDVFGYSLDELLQMNVKDLKVPDKYNTEFHYRQYLDDKNSKGTFAFFTKNNEFKIVKFNAVKVKKDFNISILMDFTETYLANKALKESEEKYRNLFEANMDSVALYRFDENGMPSNFIDCNESAHTIIGMTREELLNLSPLDVDLTEDKSKIEAIINEMKTKGMAHFETKLRHKEGHVIFVEVIASVIEFEGQPAVMNISRDITERKKTEKKLQESEKFLKTALDSMANPLYVINADDYSIALANEKGGGKDAICKKCFEVSHKSDIACSGNEHPCTLETVKRTKKPFVVEHLHHDDKGKLQNVEIHAYPIFDDEGEVKQIIEYSLNITKRKNIEQELKEQHKLFDKFFHLSNEGFFFMMLDEPIEWNESIDKEKALDYVFAHQRITKINDAMLRQYGAKREEFVGLTPNDLFAHDIKYGRDVWRKFFDQGKLHIDTKEKRLDGSELIVVGDYTCLYDDSGKIRGHFGVQSDITEQQKFKLALMESEEKFRTIIENSPYSVLITNQDGTIIDCNQTFEKITNINREKILNKSILEYHKQLFEADIRNKADVNKVKEKIKNLYSNPDVLPLTYVTSLWVNSRELYLEQIIFNIKTSSGFLLISMAQDITERKQMEELRDIRIRLLEFAANNSLYELLQRTLDELERMTGSSIGFYHFVDDDQKNLTLQAWSSRTSEEYCDIKGMHGYHYPVDEAGIWADCVREKRPVVHNDYNNAPHRKGLPDGHAEVIRELVVPVLRNNEVVAILGIGNKPVEYTDKDIETVSFIADVIWEITERKRTEEALKESHERFELAVKGSNNGIFDWNIVSGELYFSPVWKQQLGYEENEIDSKFDSFEKLLHPDDKPKVMNYVEKYLSGEIRGYDNEFRMRHKNGTYRWIRAIGSAMRDEKDKPYRMLGSHIDITEKKERELLISKQNKELEKINAEKDKFFSIIAHDLRSPLGGIMQLSEFMKDEFEGLSDEEKLNMATAIHKSSNNVFKLLMNLLDWSRLQRGMIPFKPQNYNLYNLVSESIIDLYDQAIKKEIILKVDIDDALVINCDKNMMMSAFRNLTSNAIKFSPKGSKVVIDAEKNSERLLVNITDNGIGMSDKIKDNLFNIEVNTSRKGTEGESSSGLGLILCKEFISKHSGDIYVESEPEKGSKFTVFLPV